ncbi:MAG: hypothetical protein PHV05_11215 [Candidatus Riflebacteria bacterium]|nr:hypothetical protein [Candidatus Riflebacteria bacterium]
MYDLNDVSVKADFTSDQYSEIKVDLKTPLERIFWWLAALSIASIGVVWIFSSEMIFILQWRAITAVGGVGFLFFGSLYFNTDNYYIFNLISKKMYYHFKFFFYTKVEFIADFADIHAVTFTGRQGGGDDSNDYLYRVQCILNTGEIIDLSDEESDNIDKQDRIARKISAITGAEYVAGWPGCHAVAKRADDKFSFSFYECSALDLTRQSLVEVLAGIAYVAILVAIGKNGSEIIQIIKTIFG